MKLSKAVVIGATGYVGSQVTKSLSQRGIIVECASRDPAKANWLTNLGEGVSVSPLQLATGLGDSNLNATKEGLRLLMKGSDACFFCAGFEEQNQSTIDFMVGNALTVIEIAKEVGCKCVVLTSSGGSTNPAGLQDSTPKSELLHFSDPEAQIAKGKFSPAAKTLMEIKAFEAVGRNHKNEVVDETVANAPGCPRLVIMNPNLILGPQLDPGNIKGNSLPWICKILKKERMNEFVPNDSMSIIDVRDLAELHVASAMKDGASGRYFGVNRSFPWKEILASFSEVYPSYEPPPLKPGEDYDGKVATQFDHSRKESLGVTLRPLKDTLQSLVEFLKEKGAI
mmetsp:Transcript_8692/g.17625  ORF Transcript_8692/g.17625 Transcript_8692/m.17625 type:complete len:339 (+) Transcript_8692:48-1064(+)